MNTTHRLSSFLRGIRNGFPVCLGYLAVSFSLGITARGAGLSALQAALSSLLLNASAGEYALFTMISAGSGLLETAVMELVANARYLLMSCSLSQKLPEEIPVGQRMLIGFTITDELFGLAVAEPERLSPWYYFGMMAVAMPGWAAGTYLGVVAGNILTPSVVSALGVALYGMFLAVIIPAARKNRVICVIIILSAALSFLFSVLPWVSSLSSGTRTILLTVVISGAAAVLCPIKEDTAHEN